MPKIVWNPDINTEKQDRDHFLSLSDEEKWNYMMKLIMLTYPKEKVTYDKRRIE